MDLSVKWLGREMSGPLYNASGVMCRSFDELDSVWSSGADAVITKSCTLLPREGNPEPRYYSAPFGSINSMGLPNAGYEYYLDYAKQYHQAGKAQTKPLFISVSGLSLEDNLEMISAFDDANLDSLLEINLSCPNVPGKPQLGYDFQATSNALSKICNHHKKPFGVKLPPYFDPVHFAEMASVLNSFPQLQFVTCINSVGNGLVIDVDAESVVIKPKGGLGGLGGDYVLPTALANVREFSRLLADKHVIGCGGVKSGREAFMHILAGATAVQVGTCLYEEGVACFSRIKQELAEIMEIKGYKCLDDFRGKLRTL